MSVVDLSENFRLLMWYNGNIMELKTERKKQTNERLMILGDLNCHRGEKSTHKNDLEEMEKYLCDLVKDTDISCCGQHAKYPIRK